MIKTYRREDVVSESLFDRSAYQVEMAYLDEHDEARTIDAAERGGAVAHFIYDLTGKTPLSLEHESDVGYFVFRNLRKAIKFRDVEGTMRNKVALLIKIARDKDGIINEEPFSDFEKLLLGNS